MTLTHLRIRGAPSDCFPDDLPHGVEATRQDGVAICLRRNSNLKRVGNDGGWPGMLVWKVSVREKDESLVEGMGRGKARGMEKTSPAPGSCVIEFSVSRGTDKTGRGVEIEVVKCKDRGRGVRCAMRNCR